MKGLRFISGCLSLVFVLALTGVVPQTQAAPPTPPPTVTTLPFPRANNLETLPYQASPEKSAAPAPESLDAVSLYPWSRLTFQSLRNLSDWEVYIGNDDGSGQIQLTFDGASDVHPRLNRGATRIVFASRRTGTYEIFTMNPDGSGLTQITFNSSDDVQPYWSLDGSKIAFQAYRDGQPEVYVMNADGSGQVRLTYNADYDGEPAWSPDASKIAFVSKRTGGAGDYFIYVMNADGSNQQQFSGQSYSQGPVWSPDGTRIAYSALGSDGWLNLWMMNANGSNQIPVFDEGGYAEAWARSWSPDSRYIAFTRIYYTYYQGAWYWTNAYLDAWDSQTGGVVRLSHNGYDWRPDWQSLDTAAPTSAVNALPSESPGPFTVRWGGSDNLSGIGSYDVQVKDGSGDWSTWLDKTSATSGSYPGISEHTYYFRVRARDNSGNLEAYPANHDAVTTVEALAPNSTVLALAEFSKNAVLVKWGGSDLGGSGIATYDIQYQDVMTGGNWVDWQTAVTTSSATFTGTVGHTYAFRARALDRAYNQEAYPAIGDAQTTFYAWAISGGVCDNTGVPVADATVTTLPDAARVFTSDVGGLYAAYVLTPTSAYTATWAKNGYGSLPLTVFLTQTDTNQNVFLPPLDNVIQDWGFEENTPGAWNKIGVYTPTVMSGVKHTGNYGAELGQHLSLNTPINLSPNADLASDPRIAVDRNGAVHAIWSGYEAGAQDLWYSQRPVNGAWSVPQNISNSPTTPSVSPRMIIGDDNVVHVVWVENLGAGPQLFYQQRAVDGTWSAPEPVFDGTRPIYSSEIALADDGTLHVVWYTMTEIQYTNRSPLGVWLTPQSIASTGSNTLYPLIQLGPDSSVHVVWQAGSPADVYYIYRASNGAWSAPQNLSHNSSYSSDVIIEVDNNGVAHIIWANATSTPGLYTLYYLTRNLDGSFSSAQAIGTGYSHQLVADNQGGLHLVWYGNTLAVPHIYYMSKLPGGVWSSPKNISGADNVNYPRLAVDPDRNVNVIWGSSYQVYYYQIPSSPTSPPKGPTRISLVGNVDSSQSKIIADDKGSIHIVWRNSQGNETYVEYYGTVAATASGDATLYQSVTIPGRMSDPTLSFLYKLYGASPHVGSGLTVQVEDGVGITALLSTTTNSDFWTHTWADMSAWSGQTITLTFTVKNVVGSPQTWAYLDEVSLGSTYPDIWAHLTGPSAAPPGSTVTYHLTYGNQGGAPAPATQLTLTLPAELTFVDASLPPLTSTSEVVWDVGDLAAKDGPYTIVVTATVAPTATFFSTLTSTVSVSTSGAELETANNNAQTSTFIAYQVLLPVVRRD